MSVTSLAVRRSHLLSNPIPSDNGGNHFVQFYETDDFLIDSLCLFAAAGIKNNEAVVVVATLEHIEALRTSLKSRGLNVDDPSLANRFILLDAAETLSKFMDAGVPNEQKFNLHVGRRIKKLTAKYHSVRAYGEMVGLLWSEGNVDAMIALEKLWNNLLSSLKSLSLLCGYRLNAFGGVENANTFRNVCRAHSHVIPSENYFHNEEVDDQFRRIAYLEQKASSLKVELERREKVEAVLRETQVKLEKELCERRKAEALLQESEAFKKLMIDSSQDCIKVLGPDSKILFFSKGGLAALELTDVQSVLGMGYLDFWKGSAFEEASKAFEIAKGGKASNFFGCVPTLQTLTPKWWHVVLSPIFDDEKKVTGILAVSRDVTHQKKMEDDIKKSLRARDEFLSIASHELKTPMTSLKMQLQMTKKRINVESGNLPPADKLASALEISCKQVDRLASLVDEMMDVSRIQAGQLMLHKEPLNFSALIHDTVAQFEEELKSADCSVWLNVPENEITVSADQLRLEQVLANLISNSIKYAPRSPIEISLEKKNSRVRLTVRDFGPGISSEHREKIFDRFERISCDRNVSGLGLGLFIVKQIINAHQGFVGLEECEGTGAKFIVEIPVE